MTMTADFTQDQIDKIVRLHFSGLEERRREIAEHIAQLHALAVPMVFEELYIDEERGRVKATAYLWEACAHKAGLITSPVRFQFEGDGAHRVCTAEASVEGGVISLSVEAGEHSDDEVIDGIEFGSVDVRMAALARKLLLKTEFPLLLLERSADQEAARKTSVQVGPSPVDRNTLGRGSYRVTVGPRVSRDRQAALDQRRQAVSGEYSQDVYEQTDLLAARFESEIRSCSDLGELGSIEAAIQRAASLSQWERDELFKICDATRESLVTTK